MNEPSDYQHWRTQESANEAYTNMKRQIGDNHLVQKSAQSRYAKFVPVLVVLISSLWAPGVWMLVMVSHAGEFDGELFGDRYFADYLLFPFIFLWLGAVPASVALWLLARRIGGWTIFPGLLAVPVPLLILAIGAVFAIPGAGFMMGASSTHFTTESSVRLCALVAAFSLPAWGILGMVYSAKLLRSVRNTQLKR